MTQPRKRLVHVDTTPYYHCVCRCVRRAFLCGEDRVSGQSYEHRKAWIVERMAYLAEVFAVDICAYAVMSNHYHVVVRLHPDRAARWSDDEVLARWTQLFHGNLLVGRYLRGEPQGKAEVDRVRAYAAEWRERLFSLSWFMRCLNESIARMANEEDDCTGRFWEGRFKSQALLDEQALLTCMAYVDLNPIRAGLADSPEDSDFTSIQARIRAYTEGASDQEESCSGPKLAAMKEKAGDDTATDFSLVDYFALVDWTGRAIRRDKRWHIPDHLPPILTRLGIDTSAWLRCMQRRRNPFRLVIGRALALRRLAAAQCKRHVVGVGPSMGLFGAEGDLPT